MKQNPHLGSSFEEFLESLPDDEQISIRAEALKAELCHKVRTLMKRKKIGVHKLQQMMKTSPSQIQRMLDESYTGVSLRNLVKLYSVLGKELRLAER